MLSRRDDRCVKPEIANAPGLFDGKARPGHHQGGTVKVKRGTSSIKLSCPAISAGNCTGSLVLRTAKAVKLAGLQVTLHPASVAPATTSRPGPRERSR
jgi:hypothetical protein